MFPSHDILAITHTEGLIIIKFSHPIYSAANIHKLSQGLIHAEVPIPHTPKSFKFSYTLTAGVSAFNVGELYITPIPNIFQANIYQCTFQDTQTPDSIIGTNDKYEDGYIVNINPTAIISHNLTPRDISYLIFLEPTDEIDITELPDLFKFIQNHPQLSGWDAISEDR